MLFASCKDDEDPKSSACDILSFKVDATTWTVNGLNITHVYPPETTEGTLTPTITLSPGATVSPASGVAQNFFTGQGVKYTVTAEDGVTTKEYTVKATRTQYSGCDILSFKVDTATWTLSGTNITYVYPPETTEGTLTPTITLSPGATVSPASGVAQNFFAEGGVAYTVTAQNGTTKTYNVKATRTPYSDSEIVSFTVDEIAWTIAGTNITTSAYPPETDPATQFTPVIAVSPGATVNPASGVAQNFFAEEGVTYTVTAQDGVTTTTYNVRATRTPYSGSDILTFSVNEVAWIIDGSEITYTYPAGTDPETHTTPTITLSPGATVNPASGVAQNFFTEAGVTYTVTAEDGVTTKTYNVKATVVTSEVDADGKYYTANWVVLPKGIAAGNWHTWSPDGEGNQRVWFGGHPMLTIDDDPISGWHSYAYDPSPLPQVLIIDMKTSKSISKVVGTGLYFNQVEVYVTDNPGIDGYETHTVNWGAGKEDREAAYESWTSPFASNMPETELAEWGWKETAIVNSAEPLAFLGDVPLDQYYQFELNSDMEGQFLIIRFPDSSSGGPFIGVFNLEVYK
jgi:hypothetical protein